MTYVLSWCYGDDNNNNNNDDNNNNNIISDKVG